MKRDRIAAPSTQIYRRKEGKKKKLRTEHIQTHTHTKCKLLRVRTEANLANGVQHPCVIVVVVVVKYHL